MWYVTSSKNSASTLLDLNVWTSISRFTVYTFWILDCGRTEVFCFQGASADTLSEGFSQLLRLLCWCPAQIFTVEVMETGLFVWTWLLAAAPQLGPLILAELVDAWLWTVASKRGLFAAGIDNSGPAAQLRPHLAAGVPNPPPSRDPVEGIMAHRLWLGFLLDRFEVSLEVNMTSTVMSSVLAIYEHLEE